MQMTNSDQVPRSSLPAMKLSHNTSKHPLYRE